MKYLIILALAVATVTSRKEKIPIQETTGLGGPIGGDLGGNGNISLGGQLPSFSPSDNGDDVTIGTGDSRLEVIEDPELANWFNDVANNNHQEEHDEQSPNAEGDENIDVWNGQGENDSLVEDEMLTKEQMLELGFVEVKAQPEFLRRFGVTGPMIADLYPEDPQDFVEFSNEHPLTVFDSNNEDRQTKLWVHGMRAGDFCFIKFRIGQVHRRNRRFHKFFFHCAKLLTPNDLFVRILKEECMEPEVKEPNPPVVEKCKWFYKKIEGSYEFTVREMGPFNGGDMMECYVESVKRMTRQPRVEILCSKGAIEDEEYMTLTRDDLERIKASHTHNGDNTFTGALEETEVTKVTAD